MAAAQLSTRIMGEELEATGDKLVRTPSLLIFNRDLIVMNQSDMVWFALGVIFSQYFFAKHDLHLIITDDT